MLRYRRNRGRSGHCAELDNGYADRTLQVPEKTQYATAALVRHLGGSMVVRAADQLQWDVAEPRHYGSAVVRGSTSNGDDDRSPGLHHLTARVYPPPLDYCVGGGSAAAGHQLYCRAACACDTYAPASADGVTTSTSAAGRRRVHDRDCTTPRLRTLTSPVGGEATALYSDGGPPKRRRHPGGDAADATASGGRQPADAADTARSTATRRRDDAVSSTPTSTTGGSYSVPELVTDCSLPTLTSSMHGVQDSASRTPLYSRSSS